MSKQNFRGFTIVELIIVISIISILVTIGIVSWSGAQKSAKQNAARTTIGKLKISLADYYTDTATYPANKPAICNAPTYSVVSAGDLYTELCTGTNNANYTYDVTPVSCNGTSIKCTGYTLTAKKEIWGGTVDETLTP
jgi:prepilin-type N-terminal cleavage/methylation domain-containing protein